MFLERVLVQLLQRAIGINVAVSLSITGMATRTTVPEASVELVDGVVLYVEAIYKKVEHSLFAAIARMSNAVCLRHVVGGRGTVTTKKVFLPC